MLARHFRLFSRALSKAPSRFLLRFCPQRVQRHPVRHEVFGVVVRLDRLSLSVSCGEEPDRPRPTSAIQNSGCSDQYRKRDDDRLLSQLS